MGIFSLAAIFHVGYILIYYYVASNLDGDKIVCYNLYSDKIGGTIMEKKPYHHGELKKALIENGIEFINKYGEENL